MASRGAPGSSGGLIALDASDAFGNGASKSKVPCSGISSSGLFFFAFTIYFPKQVILEPDLARVARRDVPADRAVEKSALEQETLAESRQRMDGTAPRMGAPVLLMGRLHPERGIPGAAIVPVGGVFISKMMQMPRQDGMLSAKFKLLVYAPAAEAALGPAKKPYQPVGIPIAVTNPASTVKNDPRNFVAVRRTGHIGGGIGLDARDGDRKFRGNLLVGVDAQHPRMKRMIQGKIFPDDIAKPIPPQH